MVIETHTFRLAGGAAEDDFLAADQRVQTAFFHQQPGFARRTTARGEAGEWLVIVLWGWDEAADAAEQAAADHPDVAAFTALVDGASSVRKRYSSLD